MRRPLASADAVRDDLRGLAVDELGAPDAVLIIDRAPASS